MSETERNEPPRGADDNAGLFRHKEHVKLAWLYLRKYTLLEAVVKVSEALKMFATVNGAENKYNETLTWAYIFLINERMARLRDGHTWDEFFAANPELFNWDENILKTYYSEATLNSELARRVFIFPDLRTNGKS
ncbi:MAG TPA: hypothetical protein VIP46_19610 [Pyrinomonadaceae bacterium]